MVHTSVDTFSESTEGKKKNRGKTKEIYTHTPYSIGVVGIQWM